MINVKTYTFKELTLNNEILSIYIEKFWSEVFEINKENHFYLLCKIKFEEIEDGYRTLGHLVKINYEDKDLFIDYLSERLGILNDSYVTHPICQRSFSYVIKTGKCQDKNRTLLLQDINDKELPTHNFNNMALPISMNPNDYGKVLVSNIIHDGVTFERFIVVNGNRTYQIDVMEGGVNRVTILGNIKLSWTDTRVHGGETNLIKREIKKSSIYFLDGEIVLRKKNYQLNHLEDYKKNLFYRINFIQWILKLLLKIIKLYLI
jgi:hypothetical protein